MLNPKSRLALFGPLLLLALAAAAWPRSNFWEWRATAAPTDLDCVDARAEIGVAVCFSGGAVYSVEEVR